MSVYRRILEIDPSDIERMTTSARVFGLNIRKARGGTADEYVIETDDLSHRRAIDRIVEGYVRAKADGGAS